MAVEMTEQLQKTMSSLGRMGNETVKASPLSDVVSNAVKQSMAVFTERFEKTEKNIAELQASIKDMQSTLSFLAAKEGPCSSQGAWECDNTQPKQKSQVRTPWWLWFVRFVDTLVDPCFIGSFGRRGHESRRQRPEASMVSRLSETATCRND